MVTARKLLENFPRTLAIYQIVTLDVIKVFSQVSRIAFFFLLEKETDILLIESITNPRHSVFWVDYELGLCRVCYNSQSNNNLIIFATFLRHDA